MQKFINRFFGDHQHQHQPLTQVSEPTIEITEQTITNQLNLLHHNFQPLRPVREIEIDNVVFTANQVLKDLQSAPGIYIAMRPNDLLQELPVGMARLALKIVKPGSGVEHDQGVEYLNNILDFLIKLKDPFFRIDLAYERFRHSDDYIWFYNELIRVPEILNKLKQLNNQGYQY